MSTTPKGNETVDTSPDCIVTEAARRNAERQLREWFAFHNEATEPLVVETNRAGRRIGFYEHPTLGQDAPLVAVDLADGSVEFTDAWDYAGIRSFLRL